MRSFSLGAATIVVAVTLTGCATLPRDHGFDATRELVQSRLNAAPNWSPDDPETAANAPDEPIDAQTAVRLAFAHNPAVREEFARLGLGRAEIEDARRIANPGFGFSRLNVPGADSAQITRELSLGLADVLLLSSRNRLAGGEFERLQAQVADALLNLAADVESAWLEAVGAAQVAAVRSLIADASTASMTLAQRFFDAGNISRLQLAQEQAAASHARIESTRAAAEALRARHALADLLGLRASDDWTVLETLEAPDDQTFGREAMQSLALEQRLDLRAARMSVALREEALGITRRWRWLGDVEVGIERESEPDGGRLTGPTLHLELPIFNQGQGEMARADAELIESAAAHAALRLRVQNEVNLALEGLLVSRTIFESYREALLPQLETVVEQSQREVNFMLMGVFELLQVRQSEYDAYQEYLQAVRDYWLARVELKRAVGGKLPAGDRASTRKLIGVDAILPDPNPPMMMDHSAHGGANDSGGMSHDHMQHEGMQHEGMKHEGMRHDDPPADQDGSSHQSHDHPSAPSPTAEEHDHHDSHGNQP